MKSTAFQFAFAAALVLLVSGCSGQANRLPEPRAISETNVENGRRLIASYGCGSCHSIPGIPKANAIVGPSLDHYYERSYIAGRLANTWPNLVEWIQDPQQVKPGTAMPNLGIQEDEALDIAAYLYRRPNPLEQFGR